MMRITFRNQFQLFLLFLLVWSLTSSQCERSSSENDNISEKPLSVYIDSLLPDEISSIIEKTSYSLKYPFILIDNPDKADIQLIAGKIEDGIEIGKWYYVICASFYTIKDNIEISEIKRIWKQSDRTSTLSSSKEYFYIDEGTANIIESILGKGKPYIRNQDSVIDTLFNDNTSYTILPFHKIIPSLKVVNIIGYNLLKKKVSLDDYPLILSIYAKGKKKEIDYFKSIFGNQLINRDESKMTVIVMTGTTALTRQTAFEMEKFGVNFPAKDIRPWLICADFTHISNEVSFFQDCVLDNSTTSMRFCSSEKYLELFENIGVDIIELSGNHLTDFGTAPLDHTLDLFEKKGFRWYAGGRNLSNAMEPLYIVSGPNRIAFIGACAGPSYHFATETSPGPLKADWNALKKQIVSLIQNNWLPIVTIQFWETYEYFPTSPQMEAFRLLAESGAVIVQGSQAHQPQSFDFHNNTFIHYGLGNLFFDQMWSLGTRQEFIDRHIFYDGRHIATELNTAMLEDYARPRPMTTEERKQLLTSIFSQSFWKGKKYKMN